MTAEVARVKRGSSSTGASHRLLRNSASRKPANPVVPLNSSSAWVTPEKYQKNSRSQPRPAQSTRLRGEGVVVVSDTYASLNLGSHPMCGRPERA
ncbi:hypothetical protein D3C79_1002950 [compost metagenome]